VEIRRAVRTFLSLTPTVAGYTAASIAGLVVAREVIPVRVLRESGDSVGNYLQTVGGIYAVLMAFVVYVVWGQFNDARGYVAREASAIVDVYRTVGGLSHVRHAAVMTALRAYLDEVINKEWPAMANDDDAVMERTGYLLDDVWLAIVGCGSSTCDGEIFGEVVSRFNDLTELRTLRLVSARSRLPIALKILLYSGACIIVGSMYLLPVDRVWMHMLITGAMAGCIAHILYLVVDLDEAFAGDWQVSPQSFHRARRSLDRLQAMNQSSMTLAKQPLDSTG
jgi:hypothetical protein